jgi:hypothetical protein
MWDASEPSDCVEAAVLKQNTVAALRIMMQGGFFTGSLLATFSTTTSSSAVSKPERNRVTHDL